MLLGHRAAFLSEPRTKRREQVGREGASRREMGKSWETLSLNLAMVRDYSYPFTFFTEIVE